MRPHHGDGFGNVNMWAGVFLANDKTKQEHVQSPREKKKLVMFEEVKKGQFSRMQSKRGMARDGVRDSKNVEPCEPWRKASEVFLRVITESHWRVLKREM